MKYLTPDILTALQGFLLSDHVTLKGSEVPAFNIMVTSVTMERDAALNDKQLTARVRAVPDAKAS